MVWKKTANCVDINFIQEPWYQCGPKNWNETREEKCVIPWPVHFTSNGENITIFGLESGML